MSPPSKLQHLLLPITFFWGFFGLASVQPFVTPYLIDHLQFTQTRAVTVIAFVYVTLGVCRFFVAHVISRIEKKATIILGMCGYALFPIILLFGGGFVTALCAAGAIGMGGALLWTASSAQVLDVSARQAYGRASGVLQFFTLTGIVFGTLLYGLIVDTTPSSYSRRILAAANEVHSALGGQDVLEHRYHAVFATASILGVIAIASACLVPKVHTKTQPPRFSQMLRFVSSRQHLFAPTILAIQFGTYGIMLTMTNRIVEHELGKPYMAKVHACYLGSGVAASYLAGRLSDRIGRKYTLFGCFSLAAGGAIVFATVSGFIAFAIGAVLFGIVFGGVAPVANAYVGDISTPANRPSVHAFVFAWRDFGLVIAAYLGLVLTRYADPSVCYLVFGGIFAGVALWMLIAARAEKR